MNQKISKFIHTFQKPYLSIYRMFIIPCLISAIALAVSVTLNFSAGRDYMTNFSQQSLKTHATECETSITSTLTTLNLMAATSPLSENLYGNIHNAPEETHRTISLLCQSNESIDSIFIYSKSANEVFWEDSFIPAEKFFSDIYSYSLYNTDYWMDFRFYNYDSYRTLLPTSVKQNGTDKIIIPVVLREAENQTFHNFLIVNFNLGYLISDSSYPKVSQNSDILILNRYNNTVFDASFNTVENRFSSSFLKKLIEKNSNTFNYREHSKKYLINSYSTTDSLTGYTYFSVTPYQDIWLSIFPNLVTDIIISVMLLIMGFVIAFLNAHKTAAPIYDLYTNVLKTSPKSNKNIIQSLKNSTTDLFQQTAHLQSIMPLAQTKVLKDFLNNTNDYTVDEEAKSILMESLPLKNNFYAVVIMNIIFKPSFYDTFTHSESAKIEKELHTIIKDLFCEAFDTVVLTDEKNSLSLILNSDSDTKSDDITHMINTTISSLYSDANYLKLQIGKSKFYMDIAGLKRAYTEAKFSLETININADIANLDSGNSDIHYVLKKSDETRFFNALINFDIEEAYRIVEQISEENANINSRSTQQLYYVILNIILKVLRIRNIPYMKTLLDFEIYDSILNFPPADIKKQIISILKYIHEYSAENNQKEDTASNVPQQIINYISQNYKNPLLSLDMLSEQFEIAQPKISMLVKKELKIGFHEYLTNLRIEEAKKMLTLTSLPIKNISIDCGFGSGKSFFRIFKNEVGLSPGEYRKRKNDDTQPNA